MSSYARLGDVMSTVVSMRNTSDHAATCSPADGHDNMSAGRVGGGEGGRGAVHPSRLASPPRPVRRDQLRGAARVAARVGAVWVRARRVHGSAPGEARTNRIGGGRGAVS